MMESAQELMTLAIDIGGTRLKCGILAPDGRLLAGPSVVDTPHPATPAALTAVLLGIVRQLGPYQRVSVGFPGVVQNGRVLTAPNLGTPEWFGFPLTKVLSEKLGAATRVANDATVQGLAVIGGRGFECAITLGTGMGFALFENGRPAPHLELGQHPIATDTTYDQYLGNAALRAVGCHCWNRRVHMAIGYIATLTGFDALYVGGGNARLLQGKPPANVHIVTNDAGITGGIRLWAPGLDSCFAPL